MEFGRMPFPTARHTLPHVDSAGRQGSHSAARAHTQVRGVLRRRQHPNWQAGHRLRVAIQRRVVLTLSKDAPQASRPRQAAGVDTGQRQVPPCPRTTTLATPTTRGAYAAVLAPIQPGTQSDRACLETHSQVGHPQSAFPRARRRHRCSDRAFHFMG